MIRYLAIPEELAIALFIICALLAVVLGLIYVWMDREDIWDNVPTRTDRNGAYHKELVKLQNAMRRVESRIERDTDGQPQDHEHSGRKD